MNNSPAVSLNLRTLVLLMLIAEAGIAWGIFFA